MASVREFKLPDVGEGLVEAEIVSWRVKPGDSVKVNDVVVEIETAKSLVELPCPYAGTVAELLVQEGAVVPVGTPIIKVATEDGAAAPSEAAAEAPAQAPASTNGEAAGEGRTSNLVGYGPRTGAARRRPRKGAPAQPAPAQPAPARAAAAQSAPAPAAEASAPVAHAAPSTPAPSTPAPSTPAQTPGAGTSGEVRAKPPVRKLAKDLGVDLRAVPASGPDGTISRADVQAFAALATTPEAELAAGAMAAPAPATRAGAPETRIPVRGVRRATAQAVTQSAFTAPHVTEWVSVDATATMDLLAKLKERRDLAGTKLSPLVVVAKACLLAIRRTPEFNATWDEAAGEIVLKHFVNLGIAAATPRGLMVPNIKDADRLSLLDLAKALSALTQTAREGKTPPADMQGTTFTITNVGVFGVDGGTPILNPGESGILAFGAIRKQPWVVDDHVVPRWVATLSVSFDHRIVDGEQGSRFLTDVAQVLEDPANALLLA
jgi:2-oxoisovalerate dehydrogenase E2 component (dihydrolipoyl transacylase)